jgi:hypothetical protein
MVDFFLPLWYTYRVGERETVKRGERKMKTVNYIFCRNFMPCESVVEMVENIRGCTGDPCFNENDADFQREKQERPVHVLEIGDKILKRQAVGGVQNDDGITTGQKWIWIECIVEKFVGASAWVKFNRMLEGSTYMGIPYGLSSGCMMEKWFEDSDKTIKIST